MSEEFRIRRGMPDREAVVSLLNEAYDGWGDEELFRWKYDRDPWYDDDHVYCGFVDGELVAFRRMFDRTLVEKRGENSRVFVMGDSCVATGHQGKGLYSELYDITKEHWERSDRDFIATFNREGSITYDHHVAHNWEYRTLPVRLRILSPEAVLPQYAQMALQDGIATDLLERGGHRIGLSFGESRLRGADLVDSPKGEGTRALYVPLPEVLLNILVELVSSDTTLDTLTRRITADSTVSPSSFQGRVMTYEPPINESLIDGIRQLYAEITDRYDLHFRRNQKAVHHMVNHPHLVDIVCAKRDGSLVGVAPLTLDTSTSVTEARVLDIVSRDAKAFSALVNRVEQTARARGADSIVMLSDRELGSEWIRIDRQVLMWNESDGTESLETGSLLVGLYDVV